MLCSWILAGEAEPPLAIALPPYVRGPDLTPTVAFCSVTY